MNETFSVALATYNGEKYLQEQLDSIAAQTHLPAELVVGDDGSSDKTIEILERFAETAPFPVHIMRNAENMGYSENFFNISSRCKSNWIAFCDQDDVWMETKLSKVSRIIAKNEGVGVVVHEITTVDEDLNPVNKHEMRIRFSRKIKATGGYHRLYLGLGIVFKRSLMEDIDWRLRPSYHHNGKKWAHDGWISVLSYAMTQRYLCAEPLLLYRRHTNNVFAYVHPVLSEKLTHLTKTTPGIYEFDVGISTTLSRWFENTAQNLDATAAAPYLRAASAFALVTEVYRARQKLHQRVWLGRRLLLLFKLFTTRGYLGYFRINDNIKDVIRAFVGG